MIYLRTSIIAALLMLVTSCEKGVLFDPHFYVLSKDMKGFVDNEKNMITIEQSRKIGLGCMTKDKILELKLKMRNSKQLKSSRVNDGVDAELDRLLRRL